MLLAPTDCDHPLGNATLEPTLFEELDTLFRLLGPIPLKLAERSAGKESTCLPFGGYLRMLGPSCGCQDMLEVVAPPTADPKATLVSLLQSGRLGGESDFRDSVKLSNFRAFAQALMSLDPGVRPTPKEALSHAFLTDTDEAPASVSTAPVAAAAAVAPQETKTEEPATALPPPAEVAPAKAVTVVDENDAAVEALLREGEAALAGADQCTDALLEEGEAALGDVTA
jgi:hypothetical protein